MTAQQMPTAAYYAGHYGAGAAVITAAGQAAATAATYNMAAATAAYYAATAAPDTASMAAAAQTAASMSSMQAAAATAAAAAAATAEHSQLSIQRLQGMAEQAAQQQTAWQSTGHSTAPWQCASIGQLANASTDMRASEWLARTTLVTNLKVPELSGNQNRTATTA
jgi:hypothetical protein